MNKDEIIAMARDANPEHDLTAMLPFLSRFAALVEAREREKCATECERAATSERPSPSSAALKASAATPG